MPSSAPPRLGKQLCTGGQNHPHVCTAKQHAIPGERTQETRRTKRKATNSGTENVRARRLKTSLFFFLDNSQDGSYVTITQRSPRRHPPDETTKPRDRETKKQRNKQLVYYAESTTTKRQIQKRVPQPQTSLRPLQRQLHPTRTGERDQ